MQIDPVRFRSLVEQHQSRPWRQGPGERHPALFAARQLVGMTGQVAAVQPYQLEHFVHAGRVPALRARQTEGHVLLNAQMREVTIVPAFVYGEAHGHREFATAAALLGEHPEIIPALITHRFGLDEAPRAFAVATDRAHGAIKVVLHP